MWDVCIHHLFVERKAANINMGDRLACLDEVDERSHSISIKRITTDVNRRQLLELCTLFQ